MNENERLYEQYENALFALIMNRVAEENGKALLQKNEELLADPNAAVPERLSKRCLHTIEKSYRKARLQESTHKIVRALNCVALWILIPIFMFVGVFATSETVRVKTLNLLIKEFDISTEFRTASDGENNLNLEEVPFEDDMFESLCVMLPPEFSLMTSSTNQAFENYVFGNDENATFFVTRYFLEENQGVVSVDTENATVWHETIGTSDVMFIQKEPVYQAVWIDDARQLMYVIGGENTPFDMISNIADGIINNTNGK